MTKAGTGKILKADVVVVGGGHGGCTMAALLAKSGVSVICIDQDDPQKTRRRDFDGRTTAISFGAKDVIDNAGAWNGLAAGACPIKNIRIMDSGSPVLLEFLVKDVDNPAFGWIVENRNLRMSLYATLNKLSDARHLAPARVVGFERDQDGVDVFLDDGRSARAQLVIGADGRNSFTRDWMGIETRGWSYDQRALVCIVTHENPHDFMAIEDFRSEGPFAILPMNDDEKGRHRSSVVWTGHGPEKASALHWDEQTFNAALNARFPEFYGSVCLAGPRFSYPLGLKHAHRYTGDRMALVADAAHGIHPIAGQGLNIGLRDIAALADLLTAAKKSGRDLGSSAILKEYESLRRFDNLAMAGATDALNKLFSNNVGPVRILRKAGLKMVQKIPAARKFFMRQAMGIVQGK